MKKNFSTVNPNEPAFFPWKENFMSVSAECRCKNMEAAFNRDMELCKAYVGRELLEMMQNADDQKSSVLEFRLDSANRKLTIVNSGPDTIPFDKTGFECLIRADTSGKRVMGNSAIGHKGYGFRSLLNWAEEIVIHSNGVVFSFGENARTKAWNVICNKTDSSFEAEKAKLLDRIGRAYGEGTIPLSIMSTPDPRQETEVDGPSWKEHDGFITSIAITFQESKLEDIRRQLESITPESLLFVRNLEEVQLKEIDADGSTKDVRTLSCSKTGTGSLVPGFETTELTLRDGDGETPWKKAVRLVDGNEIAVAWRADRKPLDSARRVAYTYFPTTFRLPWLPCILHATFGLDPSRNGVNRSSENAGLMCECGALLADVAAGIAQSTDWNDDSIDDEQVWFPYDMLDMGDVADTDDLLRALREGGQKKNVAVCPVTSRRYMPKDEVDCYGEEIASYLVSRRVTDCFERHVWRSFETRKYVPRETPSLEKDADKLLRKLCPIVGNPPQTSGIDFKEYVDALAILLGIREKQSWSLRVSCLPDLQCRIVEKNTTGYVNCGEMLEGAADSLGIHYVHPDFKEQCRQAGLAKGAWENGRGLVARLRDFCNCSSSDLKPMKDILILRSIAGFPDARGGNYGKEYSFREVVKCLYTLCSRKPESEPMSRYFHVLCEDGTVREAADACLWDEEGNIGIASLAPELSVGDKWRMKGSLKFWQSFLQSETAKDKEQLVSFFHGFLGVSLSFPCKVLYCSQCDGGRYLQEQCKTAKSDSIPQCKPHYFNAWTPPSPGADSFQSSSELESNSLYGLDEDFWGSLRLARQIDFFDLVTRDPTLCKRIAYSPVVFASFYTYPRPCTFKESYLAYSIRNRITDVTADTVEEQIKDWEPERKRRARELMRVLGISREIEDLPVEEIYDRIARRRDPHGIGSFYSRARLAIRKRIEEGATTEEDCSQLARANLKQLFARVKNPETGAKELKLVDRGEIQYWDNALVSKSLLDSLPKLEIGSRIGAASVERLFGVHQLKSDDIRVLDSVENSEETELSEAVNARLRKLRTYLLAVRFRDEWRDDGNPKIDTEANKCKTFEVRIVHPVPQAFTVAGRDTKFGLSDGDLLQDKTKKVYWICSTATTIDELWSRNAFRKSVVEALCIHFQLTTGTQIESAFREVLRNTAQENEELRFEMLPDDRWKELVAALGLSDEERAFWKVVAAKAGKGLTDEDFDSVAFDAGKWKTRLASWFGIDALPSKINGLPDFPKMTPNDLIALARWCKMAPNEVPASVSRAIRESVVHQADEWRFRTEASFAARLHKKLEDKDCGKKTEYVPILHQFMELPTEDMAARFMEDPAFPEDVNRRIGEILCDEAEKRFAIRPATSAEESKPNPQPEYDDILRERTLEYLPYEEQSLAFFPGNRNSLREAFERQEARHAVPKVVGAVGNSETVVEYVLRAEDLKCTSASSTSSPKSGKAHSGGGGFDTDAEKLARGETAEQIAERMLEHWKETGKCLQYGARSSISGRTGMADDGAHFDFWYETPDHEIRLIDVKFYAGSRVILTEGERKKAMSQAWRSKYDLVLVMEGKPFILKGPLFGNDSEFRNSIQLEPATYNLRIELRRQTAEEPISAPPVPMESSQP